MDKAPPFKSTSVDARSAFNVPKITVPLVRLVVPVKVLTLLSVVVPEPI